MICHFLFRYLGLKTINFCLTHVTAKRKAIKQNHTYMKKFILAVDERIIQSEMLDLAIRITAENQAVLTGLFIVDTSIKDYYSMIGGEAFSYEYAYDVIKKELNQAEQKNIDLINKFVEICKKHKIQFKVHLLKGLPLDELVEQSRYADLLMTGFKSFISAEYDQSHQELVKLVLEEAKCPVLLLPENAQKIGQVVFAYDGKDSSIVAIKEYAHVFAEKAQHKMHTVVTVSNPKEDAEIPAALVEYLRLQFPKLKTEILNGNAREELLYYAKQMPDCMLVMGSYGRSSLSRFFSKSAAEMVLQSGKVAVFITHE